MVLHVGGEEHERQRTSLLRGSECAAGYLAAVEEDKVKEVQDVYNLTWKKLDLKV